MKVNLVGRQLVSYTKKQTGEFKEGMSLFYTAPKDGVSGECSDSIWIRKDSPLYDPMLTLDFSAPVAVDVLYGLYPGSRFPVLEDIIVL